jgi:hypothetical protein
MRVLAIVLFALIITGCRPPDSDLRRFEAGVRSSVSAEEAEAWANSVCSNSVGTLLPASDLPGWIRGLPDSPRVLVCLDAKTGDKIVTLNAGGGFGMWGMVVGPPNYQSSLGSVRHHWTTEYGFIVDPPQKCRRMNSDPQPASGDHASLRPVRFAFVCIVVGLSYFTFRATVRIPDFQRLFADMLDGAPLPILTSWVLRGRWILCVSSMLFPLAAFATLFTRISGRSFYVLGVIALMVFLQFAIICQALTEPLLRLIDQLGATPK